MPRASHSRASCSLVGGAAHDRSRSAFWYRASASGKRSATRFSSIPSSRIVRSEQSWAWAEPRVRASSQLRMGDLRRGGAVYVEAPALVCPVREPPLLAAPVSTRLRLGLALLVGIPLGFLGLRLLLWSCVFGQIRPEPLDARPTPPGLADRSATPCQVILREVRLTAWDGGRLARGVERRVRGLRERNQPTLTERMDQARALGRAGSARPRRIRGGRRRRAGCRRPRRCRCRC